MHMLLLATQHMQKFPVKLLAQANQPSINTAPFQFGYSAHRQAIDDFQCDQLAGHTCVNVDVRKAPPTGCATQQEGAEAVRTSHQYTCTHGLLLVELLNQNAVWGVLACEHGCTDRAAMLVLERFMQGEDAIWGCTHLLDSGSRTYYMCCYHTVDMHHCVGSLIMHTDSTCALRLLMHCLNATALLAVVLGAITGPGVLSLGQHHLPRTLCVRKDECPCKKAGMNALGCLQRVGVPLHSGCNALLPQVT